LVESKAEGPRNRLDVAGSVSVTAGLVVLVYAIVHTDVVAWTSTSTLVALALAAALLGSFVVVEARLATHPLIPLRLFRSRGVTGANLAMFCFGGSMFAMWYFLTLYLQKVLGYSPLVTGFTFIPQTAAIAAGATISGRLSPKLGARNVLVVGALLAAGGLTWLSFIQPGDTYWNSSLGGGIMCTFGMGLAFTPIALSAMGGVQPHESGLASGLVNTSRQVGASLGLAVLSTVAAVSVAHHLAGRAPSSEATRAALTAGYARGFEVAAAIALAGGLVALMIPSSRTAATSDGAPDGEATEPAPMVVLD
jgi:predicted MFS family arabinose efflux permease